MKIPGPVRYLARSVERTVPRVRARLSTARWRLSLKRCGARTLICPGARFAAPGSMSIGDDVFIGADARISTLGGLDIADDVMIGHSVNIQGGNHSMAADRRQIPHDPDRNPPISIGRAAWIGSRATILAGADIGEFAVVASGAVCTKPVPAWTVVGGVPARVLKELDRTESSEIDQARRLTDDASG